MKKLYILFFLLLTIVNYAYCGDIPYDIDYPDEPIQVKKTDWSKYKYSDDKVFFSNLKECKEYYHEDNISKDEAISRYIDRYNSYDECVVVLMKTNRHNNELIDSDGCFIPKKILKTINKKNFYKKVYCTF